MSRRRQAVKRPMLKDAKFNSTLVSRLVNTVMQSGKKSLAQRIVYGAFDEIAEKNPQSNPMEVLQRAVDNAKPRLEVKARRVGGVVQHPGRPTGVPDFGDDRLRGEDQRRDRRPPQLRPVRLRRHRRLDEEALARVHHRRLPRPAEQGERPLSRPRHRHHDEQSDAQREADRAQRASQRDRADPCVGESEPPRGPPSGRHPPSTS